MELLYHSKKKGLAAIEDYLANSPGPTFDMKELACTWIQTIDLYPHAYAYVIHSQTVGEDCDRFYLCALYKIPGKRYYYVCPHYFLDREEADQYAEVLAKNYVNFAFMDRFLKTLQEKEK